MNRSYRYICGNMLKSESYWAISYVKNDHKISIEQ